MIITPRVGKRLGSISSVKSDSNMSICNASNVSVSLFKLSFSNSDSTPCPRQPRKRLKFKDTTPSGTPLSLGKRKNLLNLSSSKKASISILTQFTEAQEELSGDDVDENDLDDDIHKHDNGDDGNYESYENYEESDLNGTPNTESSKFPNLNTPISQSTPANSRPPTPPLIEEYGDPIKGYKLLREQSSDADIQNPYYSYKTPENNKNLSYSQMMRNSYIGGNPTPELSQNTSGSGYQIVGEFPVTSAGLMNEDDVDLHIGDKRINDPYNSGASTPGFNSTPGFKSTPGGSKLKFQSMTDDSRRQEIKDEYLNGGKLPLLKQFETNLSTEEIISLINDDKSLFEFYEYITNDGNDNKNNNNSNNNIDMDILDMVKKERLKWHPDKWIGNITVDKEVIENLSKALNTLVERLR